MTVKPKLDPRKMMLKAVEVMERSIAEDRNDGKKSPLVGAVLVKADGSVETAFRGELRNGDHAEFTLLERKNRATRLDGAVLFATLEPCAPGARSHPKLGCAERIVNARIKEVWVGIEDPDPTVDRKGISYLRSRGVKVQMFERDLQERIRQANREFLAQAVERRTAGESAEDKFVPLSFLENPVANADLTDFSSKVLERYRLLAKLLDPIDTPEFSRRLVQQGLLHSDGRKLAPTGFGVLLFGKTPRDLMPQAGMLGTIHYPDGSEEVRDFDGPALDVPEDAIHWLKDKLPSPISRSGARRKESSDGFYELAREGIVNALVHRDYDLGGAKCQLVISADTVVVKSPGGPVEPITLKQLQSFDAPMLSRNPALHYVFAKMELAEERGLGLKSMRARASALGLPLPTYGWDNPYLVLTMFRTAASALDTLAPAVRKGLKVDEQAAWEFAISKPSVSTLELMERIGLDERKAQRVIKRLLDTGLLKRVGRGPATRYVAVL